MYLVLLLCALEYTEQGGLISFELSCNLFGVMPVEGSTSGII